ncbi:MAG TPA: DUF1801 domain-containing protein [Thermoanaerobaculia bacterium]|nr:DUF1801 domain-containing protein [Thermoanaerobaculia bacterium]
MKSAREQLASFLAKFSPEVAATGNAALRKMRKLFPGAVELVYDNYNALAIGFAPSERASEVICSIAIYPKWVTLFFLHGVGLPDPRKLLGGSGSRVRQIRLESADDLDNSAIRALIKAAISRSPNPLDATVRGRLVIKSVSKRQRPRRPEPKPAARSRAR